MIKYAQLMCDVMIRFNNIMKFYMSLSHPLSNERAHDGWAQKKIFNIATPGCRKRQF